MPSSRDLPNPGIKSRSPALQVDSLPSEPPGKPSRMDTQHQKPFSPLKKSHWLCSGKRLCPPHSLAVRGQAYRWPAWTFPCRTLFLHECHRDEGTVRNSLTAVMLRISSWNPPVGLVKDMEHACVHAKPLWSCPTLCDPIDHSPPGSSVHGILQARMLEWLPFPPPGDLPNPGIELVSLTPPALADGFFTIREAPKDTQAPFLLSGFLNSSPTCFSSCLSRPAVMISRSALLSLCQW